MVNRQILPKPKSVRGAIKALLLAERRPLSMLDIGLRLERDGLVRLTPEARLYHNHPQRQEIAGHVKALYDAGELAGMDV